MYIVLKLQVGTIWICLLMRFADGQWKVVPTCVTGCIFACSVSADCYTAILPCRAVVYQILIEKGRAKDWDWLNEEMLCKHIYFLTDGFLETVWEEWGQRDSFRQAEGHGDRLQLFPINHSFTKKDTVWLDLGKGQVGLIFLLICYGDLLTQMVYLVDDQKRWNQSQEGINCSKLYL